MWEKLLLQLIDYRIEKKILISPERSLYYPTKSHARVNPRRKKNIVTKTNKI